MLRPLEKQRSMTRMTVHELVEQTVLELNEWTSVLRHLLWLEFKLHLGENFCLLFY